LVMRILPRQNLRGLKFNRLLVLEPAPDRFFGHQKYAWACWKCRCDCGKEVTIVGSLVKTGRVKSCGCLWRDSVTTHGESSPRTPEFWTWTGMKQRCLNRNLRHYKDYGGRGIKVCRRWLKYENFLTDMGRKPTRKHTLERKDGNGNYCPSNCIWATPFIQQNNKCNNRFLSFCGESLTLAQWTRKMGFPLGLLRYRLSAGWGVERTLMTPPDPNKQRFKFANKTACR
jgi:hypothetical protein